MRPDANFQTDAARVCSSIQHTFSRPVTLRGHTLRNHLVNLTFAPANPDTGLVFCLMHHNRIQASIPVRAEHAAAGSAFYGMVNASWSELHKTDGDGIVWGVGVVEHVLSALRRLGIDNARIDVDFPVTMPWIPFRRERIVSLPLFDGTAGVFMEMLRPHIQSQPPHRRQVWVVHKPWSYTGGGLRIDDIPMHMLVLQPRHQPGFRLEIDLHPHTGQQRDELLENRGIFAVPAESEDNLLTLPAGLVDSAQPLRKNGLAFHLLTLGTDREPDFSVGPHHIRPREQVAHRVTDVIGDWGRLGPFQMNLSGHYLNHAFMNEALHVAISDGVLQQVTL